MYKSLIIYEDNFYPKKAIEYLSENKLEGRLFSEYGWGGYLIWKYPEKKVFIDGRMPSWKWINAPENESSNAFDDYMSLLSGKTDYKDTFGKFSIDTVLWPKEKPMSSFDSFKERMINVFKKYQKDKLFNFTSQLLNDGWNIIYEDEISTIFQKPS